MYIRNISLSNPNSKISCSFSVPKDEAHIFNSNIWLENMVVKTFIFQRWRYIGNYSGFGKSSITIDADNNRTTLNKLSKC